VKKALLIISFLLFAQSSFTLMAGNDKPAVKVITGKVTDRNGEAIAGAEIKIIETGEVIFADLDGEFKLQIDANKNHSIQINTLGFLPKTVKTNTIGFFTEVTLNQL